jgi:serine/threonine protein kinase
MKEINFIPFDSVTKCQILGKGGMGEVWLAFLNKHTKIAMKNLIDDLSDDDLIKVAYEVEVMEKARHPKLIQFYGFWKDQDEKTSWLIDNAPGGDLSKFLHNQNERKLTMIDKFEIIIDIAIGIQAFHSINMVHRDIKPHNVLFLEKITKDTKMISAKLSDYGEVYDLNSEEFNYIQENAEELDEFDCGTDYNGTIQYAPPEILKGDLRLLSTKSDIYSFGVLIWEVFTEKKPYDNNKLSLLDLSSAIIEENLNPLTEINEKGEVNKIEYLKGTPIEIEELVNKCISTNPQDRPSINEVIEIILRIQEKNNLNYATR